MQACGFHGIVCQATLEALLSTRAGKLLVLGKKFLVAFGINRKPALRCKFAGKLQGKAVGVVQVKCVFAVYLPASFNGIHNFVGKFCSLVNGFRERVNFFCELLNNKLMMLGEFREFLFVNINQNFSVVHQFAEGNVHFHAMAHRAANNAAQHIALVNVRGHHATLVAQQKRGRTHVVAYQANVAFCFFGCALVFNAGCLFNTLDNGKEQLGVIHRIVAVYQA